MRSACRTLFRFGLMMVAACAAFSQDRPSVVFEFGAAAGVPFNTVVGRYPFNPDQITAVQNLERPKIVAGPVIEAILSNKARIEFGAMFRPNRYDIEIVTLGSCIDAQCTMRNRGTASFVSGHGQLWEFPISASYYLRDGRIRPYVGGGVLLSQDLAGTNESKITDPTTGQLINLSGPLFGFRPNWPSLIANAGVEWSRSRFRLRPELRYTRHRANQEPLGVIGTTLNPNQIDLLVGFSFAPK